MALRKIVVEGDEVLRKRSREVSQVDDRIRMILDDMLEKVAMWYDQELDEQIKAMTSLMEPIMIIFVGGIVALIAMAIFGPMTAAMQGAGWNEALVKF